MSRCTPAVGRLDNEIASLTLSTVGAQLSPHLLVVSTLLFCLFPVGFGPQQNSSLYDEQIEAPDSHSESYYYTVYGVTLPVMLFLGIIKGIACTVVSG